MASANNFSIELPGSSMLELAVKQIPSHGGVSLELLGSQRSQISIARRQALLSVLVESGSALTDCMRIEKTQSTYRTKCFYQGF